MAYRLVEGQDAHTAISRCPTDFIHTIHRVNVGYQFSPHEEAGILPDKIGRVYQG